MECPVTAPGKLLQHANLLSRPAWLSRNAPNMDEFECRSQEKRMANPTDSAVS